MIKKQVLIVFLLAISMVSVCRTHSAVDTISFNTSSFVAKLDSLYYNQLRTSLIPYEQVNRSMLACAKPSAQSVNDSLIFQKMNSMKSVIHVGNIPKIKEFLDILLFRRPEAACLLLSLSNYYVPIFESVFEKYNIPVELAYLPSVISTYNPASIAPFGSTGLWNIMYLSGKMYNLEINSMVDERKNVEKSTEAAARQLKDLYSIYKDWTLTLTAYITGPAIVNKAIRRANGKQDFWDLYPFLPSELRDYIPAYAAMNFFVQYHTDFGYKPLAMDLPVNSDTVHVSKELHLEQVSKVLDIPINSLRSLNPQFKKDILPAQSKVYVLYLPSGFGDKFRQTRDQVYSFCDSVVTRSRQSSYEPAFLTGKSGISGSVSRSKTGITYVVRSGESLGSIARKFNVSIVSLKSWNKLKSTTIRPGQKLVVNPFTAQNPSTGKN
jgi:membrane-bound lytic murein transglycosylase D